MRELIMNNMDFIISFVTIIVTWILGYISKKNPNFSNNMIPIQNIIIMVIVVSIYWFVTGDFNMVVASSSPVATIIYDAFHCMKCSSEN